MSYKKLLKNLEALPENKRRLAGGAYVFYDDLGMEDCGCVLGKGLPKFHDWILSNKLESNESLIESVMAHYPFTSPKMSQPVLEGMSVPEAHEVQLVNDDFHRGMANYNDLAVRQERYHVVIDWLKRQVAQETQEAQEA